MRVLKWLFGSVFFGKRFYRFMAVIIFLFVVSYGISFFFTVAVLTLALFLLTALLDYLLLFAKQNPVAVRRILPDKLSNGDENPIKWEIKNNYSFRARLQLLDEFPEPWQIRDFRMRTRLEPDEKTTVDYIVRPKERGEFFFGNLHLFIKTPLQLIIRRKTLSGCFPDFCFSGSLNSWPISPTPGIPDTSRCEKKVIAWSSIRSGNMSAAMISGVLIGRQREEQVAS